MKSSLRLRPDRIIVGEVRGEEVLDLIQAMNTGHKGCMGTIHANTALDALFRMEALAQEAQISLSKEVLRHQISEACDLVVQLARCSDGQRKVVEIVEVINSQLDGNAAVYKVKSLFKISPFRRGEDGRLQAKLEPTGELPSFIEEIKELKTPFSEKHFQKVS